MSEEERRPPKEPGWDALYGATSRNHSKRAPIKRCLAQKKYFDYLEYDENLSEKDFAVCEVAEPFQLDPENAWPICLPDQGTPPVQPGDLCETVGWGAYNVDDQGTPSPNMSDVLRGKKVRILPPPSIGPIGDVVYFESFVCGVSTDALSFPLRLSNESAQKSNSKFQSQTSCNVTFILFCMTLHSRGTAEACSLVPSRRPVGWSKCKWAPTWDLEETIRNFCVGVVSRDKA